MLGLKPTTTTILLVAPSDMRRTMVAQQLEALGYSVIVAADPQTLTDLLTFSQYDLIVMDLSSDRTSASRSLSDQAARLLAQGTPVLMLTLDQQSNSRSWTQETLSYRVGAALRNRNVSDVISERMFRYEGLNVLDPETTLFSRRYFDAIFPTEIERSRRIHQPMTVLLLAVGGTALERPSTWQLVSARILTSLRQTDILVRFSSEKILIVLPFTEAGLGRVVAARLIKTLGLLTEDDPAELQFTIGLASFPRQGTTPNALLSAVQHAQSQAVNPGEIVSSDE